MKNFKYLLGVGCLVAGLLTACSTDEIDEKNSIFQPDQTPKSAFDNWLDKTYMGPYNISYIYRMKDNEVDFSKNHVPSSLENSMKLAKIIKYAWIDAYTEVAGEEFMRIAAPRVLQIIGSASWNRDGTMTLGTAEGGIKVTLYMGNWLNENDPAELNRYFFNTMHHEFAHILHQTKQYPKEYNVISTSDYRPTAWHNRRTVESYAQLGFISNYAGSQPREDIAEVTCRYLTFSDSEWNQVVNAAGEEGAAKIAQKLKLVKEYMLKEWGIDMDLLKKVVARRMAEVSKIELLEPEWKRLLNGTNSIPTSKAALKIVEDQLRSQWGEVVEAMEHCPHCCHAHNANLYELLNSHNDH